MSDRNLTTTRRQVFGDVDKGTKCRICGRKVTDGRSKTCSDYCDNILRAVMSLLNWTPVRRRIIDRDGETCVVCGYDRSRYSLARDHIRDIIQSQLPERPPHPAMDDLDGIEDFDWDEYHDKMDDWRQVRDDLRDRYSHPDEIQGPKGLEVDHITPVSEGGHPFDPANLQTLCEDCHEAKTVREHKQRADARTPSKGDLSESILEYGD
jgi:5-methylcytosine-specific restriction endonuclease McrA